MHSLGAGPFSCRLRPGVSYVKVAECVQVSVFQRQEGLCVYSGMGQGQGTSGCADRSVLPLSVHSSVWGQGSAVRRADSRPASTRSEGRGFGGSQGLCVWGLGVQG